MACRFGEGVVDVVRGGVGKDSAGLVRDGLVGRGFSASAGGEVGGVQHHGVGVLRVRHLQFISWLIRSIIIADEIVGDLIEGGSLFYAKRWRVSHVTLVAVPRLGRCRECQGGNSHFQSPRRHNYLSELSRDDLIVRNFYRADKPSDQSYIT